MHSFHAEHRCTLFSIKMPVDYASAFTIVRYTRRAEAVRTIAQISGMESHNSYGSGERYRASLQRIFKKNQA